MNARGSRLSVKELIIYLIVFLLGSVFVVYVYFSEDKEQREFVMQLAMSVEASLPRIELEHLPQNTEDISKSSFQHLRAVLQKVIIATPKARFAYVYIERNGKLYFLADSELETSSDYSPSGQLFSEASGEYFEPIKSKIPCLIGPATDRWGKWLSAEVPIFDAQTNEVLAVFGMDYSVDSWYVDIIFHEIQTIIFVLVAFSLVFIAGRLKRKNGQLRVEINQRQKIEDNLRESQHSLANLISSLPGLIYRCALDRDYTMEYISDACLRITGYAPSDFVANKRISFNDIILPEDRERIWNKWQTTLVDGSVFEDEYQIQIASGEIKWLWERGRCVYDNQNKLRYLEGYIEDISFRKKAENELKKLSLAIEQNPVSVVIASSEGIIEYVNPRFSEMTGYDASEIIGQNPRILKSGKMGREFYAELLNTINSGKIWKGEILNKNKKGELFWVSQSISPIIDQNNRITHFVAIEEDISEKKKIEQELILAKEKAEESNRLKSAFLANISHEIRTPMNGILGFSELLSAKKDMSSEEGLEYLSIIFQSSKRLLEMLNNLIDISKIQSGEKNIHYSNVNIKSLLQSLSMEFLPKAKEKSIQLKMITQEYEDLTYFISDREKLEKALTCLLDNACKFTNKGNIDFGYKLNSAGVHFFVKDTGIGIPEDKKEVIFEIFRQGNNELTRQHEGAGLGLAIARTYIEWLGGKIILDSTIGQGSLFIVELPFIQNEAVEAVQKMYTPQKERQNINLLIADDDSASRIFIEKSLKDAVTSIMTANNGQEVIEIVRANPQINLILMDLKMPVLDGFDATRAIKFEKPEIHIIAQTAFDEARDRSRALDAGCSDIITKPININKLRTTIARLIPILIFLFFISCRFSNHSNNQQIKNLYEFEAKGYTVPDDSLQPPVVTPAVVQKTFTVGKLPVKESSSNVYTAKKPVLLSVNGPKICTPGLGMFLQPRISKAVIQKKLCKEPEIVMAKDPASKEINPDNFLSFSKLQGLKHDQVRGAMQDNMGNLWFATDEGLTCFDGKYFSHYSTDQGLTNSLILSVFQDSKSNIWIGTFRGGVTRYDGCYLTNFTNKDGFPNDIVNCITEDLNGNIWFGTGGGIVKFDGEKFTNYAEQQGLCNNDVRHILVDKEGRLWIATNKGGFSIFDGKNFRTYSVEQGLGTSAINCISIDKQNNFWLASPQNGLIKFNGKSFYSYTQKEGLSSDELSYVTIDKSDNLWIGTMNKGIIRFDGSKLTNYDENKGVSSNVIRCILVDKSGKLWFGTKGGGVTRFEGDVFNHLAEEQGLRSSMATKITVDRKNNIWIGTNGGYVTKITREKVSGCSKLKTTSWGSDVGIYGSRVYDVMEDRSGNIWFGSDGGGVACFDGKTVKVYTRESGLQSSSVRRIIQDKKGNYWIGTYGEGMAYFDGKNFVKYTTREGLINNNIQSLLEDNQGRIWIGTDVGACCFDGKRFTHYKQENGLSNYPVYSIKMDSDGDIWFGTGGNGVICYSGNTFTHITTDQGLNSNFVMSIIEDSHHNIWFGTRSGPSVMSLNELKIWKRSGFIQQMLFRNFDYEDGFLGIGCNYEALNEDQDGEIWIGANDRVSIFRGKLSVEDTIPPVVVITKVNLFNEEIPWNELFVRKDTSLILNNGIKINGLNFGGITPWYNIPENPSFSYSNNYLSFNFIGITQFRNKRLQYQVKLEGLDKDWGSPSKRTEVSFGNLPSGKYVLKIRAMNSEGVWSKVTTYPFIIRSPWWQTWWFYLLSFTFVINGILLLIQYRVQKIKNDKIILQEKVDEQTIELIKKNEDIRNKNKELLLSNTEKDKLFSIIAHDVRGPLSTFLPVTDFLAEEIEWMDKQDIKELARSMNNSAKNLYELLTNLLEWSRIQRGSMPFDPVEIRLKKIVDECIAVVIGLAQNKNISITEDVPDDITIFADRYMIASVIRNLLTNAIKFTAREGTIIVKARFVNNAETEISVKDTGIGIPRYMAEKLFSLNMETSRYGTEGEPSTGLGLNLCKDFIDQHKGTIQVFSKIDRGSTFVVTLKSRAPES